MIPVTPNVNIKKAERKYKTGKFNVKLRRGRIHIRIRIGLNPLSFPVELIGPWYIGEGSDFGFNDLWYRDISLDANKTSIIFQKSGLHLIYAQVSKKLSSTA